MLAHLSPYRPAHHLHRNAGRMNVTPRRAATNFTNAAKIKTNTHFKSKQEKS
jgi:hypothetical protein